MLDDDLAEMESHNPAAWEREYKTYGGRNRMLDFHTAIAIRYALRAINLHRYLDNPGLSTAVRSAREAVDLVIDELLVDRHDRSQP